MVELFLDRFSMEWKKDCASSKNVKKTFIALHENSQTISKNNVFIYFPDSNSSLPYLYTGR